MAYAICIDGISFDDLHLRHAAVIPDVTLRNLVDARRCVRAQYGGVVLGDGAVFGNDEFVLIADGVEG